jgi:hypothetical protein
MYEDLRVGEGGSTRISFLEGGNAGNNEWEIAVDSATITFLA